MSEEIKFSVPRWVVDSKTPHQTKSEVEVKVKDTNGNGKWDRSDEVSVNGGKYEDDPETTNVNEAHENHGRLMGLLGVSDGKARLSSAGKYFDQLGFTARQASRGRMDKQEVIDSLDATRRPMAASGQASPLRGVNTRKTSFRVFEVANNVEEHKAQLARDVEKLETKAKNPDRKFWSEAGRIRLSLNYYGMKSEAKALDQVEHLARRYEAYNQEFASL